MTPSTLIARLLLWYGVHLPDHPRKWWVHSKLLKLFSVSVPGEFEVERVGCRWRLTPSDYCQSSLYWRDAKDTREIAELLRLLPADAVVLDVGANFGYHSVRLAKSLTGRPRIHAIEPNPTSAERLRRNLHLNGLTDVVRHHPIGVSDRPGVAHLVEPEGNSAHARIKDDANGILVELVTIDSLVESLGLDRLDAIVLDVEGFEHRALAGAERTLERFKPIVMVELWPPVLAEQGTDVEAVAEILEHAGYALFDPAKSGLVPVERLPEGIEGRNIFALPADRFVK